MEAAYKLGQRLHVMGRKFDNYTIEDARQDVDNFHAKGGDPAHEITAEIMLAVVKREDLETTERIAVENAANAVYYAGRAAEGFANKSTAVAAEHARNAFSYAAGTFLDLERYPDSPKIQQARQRAVDAVRALESVMPNPPKYYGVLYNP